MLLGFNLMKNHLKVKIYADFNRTSEQEESAKKIRTLFCNLCHKNASRKLTQKIIKSVTEILLDEQFQQEEFKHPVVIPILRAGLPMWQVANEYFDFPKCLFISASKIKGTDKVKIEWLKKADLSCQSIILLDTVIATGDTICAVIDEIYRRNQSQPKIEVVSCYVSPQGLNKIRIHGKAERIIVGILSTSIDSKGYLIPHTEGDVGDKMFTFNHG